MFISKMGADQTHGADKTVRRKSRSCTVLSKRQLSVKLLNEGSQKDAWICGGIPCHTQASSPTHSHSLSLLSSYFSVSKKVIRQLFPCGSSSSGGQEGGRHGKNDKGLYLPVEGKTGFVFMSLTPATQLRTCSLV